jgi:hypothetical protein
VINTPAFPNLQRLELSGFVAPCATLVSVLRFVAPTLTTLKLRNLRTMTPTHRRRRQASHPSVNWLCTIDAMRKIFSHNSPPLNLSFSFREEDYLDILRNLKMPTDNLLLDEWLRESAAPMIMNIENYITDKNVVFDIPDVFEPMM